MRQQRDGCCFESGDFGCLVLYCLENCGLLTCDQNTVKCGCGRGERAAKRLNYKVCIAGNARYG